MMMEDVRTRDYIRRFVKRWNAGSGAIVMEAPSNIPICIGWRKPSDNLYLECGHRVWDAAGRPV